MNIFTKLEQAATAALLLACPVLAVAQQNVIDNLVRPSTGVADSTGLVPIPGKPAFGAVIDYTKYRQLTNIPTLYLTCKPGVTLDYVNKTETYYDATIVLVDQHGTIKQRNEDVTFRGRGNATWNSGSAKKPWRLKFPNKTSLLTEYDLATGKEVKNYADAKSWTLLSNHFDKSMIRNAVTYELGKLIGLPFCPAYKFVDLVLNGEYYGTYQISDHMEVAKKRVFVRDKDLDWMIELCDGMYGEDPQFTAGGYHFNVKSPEDDATIAAMRSYMTNVMNAMGRGNGMGQYVNLKSLADYIMGVDITANFDGVKGNNYCYRGSEPTDLLNWGPIWDMDLGFGNFGGLASCTDGEHKHMWQVQSGYYDYLFKAIYESAEFQMVFYPRWKKVYAAGLAESLNVKIDKIYNEVKTSAIKNYVEGGHRTDSHNTEKWSMSGTYMGKTYTDSHNETTVATDYEQSVKDIKTFLSEHIEWLNEQYAKDYKTITGLDPETAVEPEDEEDPKPGSDGGTQNKGLSLVHDTEWEGYGGTLYTYTGSANTMKEGSTIEITTTQTDTDLYYGSTHTTMWKDGPNTATSSFTLTAEEAATLAQNGYTFLIVVWHGECTNVKVTPVGGNNTDDPDSTPTDDSKPGALVINADGTYTFTGSATSFKAGAVITILTENVNATVSTQIAGNVWQNSKSITLTAEDVNKLKAAGYTFAISTSDAVKAITVKAPASQGTDGEKKTYNATIVNKCFSIPANDIPVGTEKISITIVGNGGSGIWVKYNLKGSSNEYDSNTKTVKGWDGNTRTASFDIADATEISQARTYGINILTGDFKTATITIICSGSGIAAPPAVTPTRTLSLTASEGGSVSGAGTYDENTTVIINAVAAEGYKFKGWSDGNTLATRSVTLTSDNISLTAAFVAESEEIPGEDDSDPFNEKGEHQQLTNLPTIYLTAMVGDEWSGATLEVFDQDNLLGQGTSWTKGTATADLSVQFQGSGEKNKDSYRLKFESKTQLLSSGKYKQWVLLANDDDPSLMRNALAKEMGDVLGLPFTPGYQFVDLYVNNAYMGTYQVTDRIKAEDGRALIEGGDKEADWHVRLNDEGEFDEDKPTYYVAGSQTMPYIIPKNPDPKDDKTTWDNSLSGAMTTYFEPLFAKDQSGHYTAFADGVDRQQLIQWYVAQEILCVYKGFSSIEAYRSVTSAIDQKLHIGILWDSEKSMGNTCEAPTLSMEDKGTNTTLGLMTSYAAYGLMKNIFTDLWQQAWFANGVKNLWDEKNETVLAAMKVKAGELKEVLTESQELDAAKWNNTANYNDAVSELTSWLDTRFAYLTTKFTALANALPCTEHTFNNKKYALMEDKTYRRACDNCGAAEEGGDVYYLFKVYEEAKTPTLTYTTIENWQSLKTTYTKPNTLFVTEAEADALHGRNVVVAGYCDELVITDGYPFYNPAEFKAQEASYKRMVKAETQWGTLCLPFKVVDNDDVALFTLTGVTTTGDDSKPGLMTFSPATKTGKATPLVFRKKTSDATEVCFTAGKKNGSTITVAESKDCDKNISEEVSVPGWQLFGNVKKTQSKAYTKLAPEGYTNIYVISGDKFWHATGTVTIHPFRAFFGQADTEQQGPAAAQFRICINGADGIDYIEQEVRHETPAYDIQGRKVRAGHEAAKGLYVVDGKKILVR